MPLQVSLRSCCCEECVGAPRLLRPAKDAGYYGGLANYAIDSETQASIASVRAGISSWGVQDAG